MEVDRSILRFCSHSHNVNVGGCCLCQAAHKVRASAQVGRWVRSCAVHSQTHSQLDTLSPGAEARGAGVRFKQTNKQTTIINKLWTKRQVERTE